MESRLSRRSFLQASAAAALAGSQMRAANPAAGAAANAPGPYRGVICMFSKPVPQLSWSELARAAKRAGYGGIDLTVRPNGHVKPERAAEDLPRAVEAIRAEGMEVPMITTALLRADEPTAVPILSAAQKMSIPFFKPGYYHYKFVDVRKEAAEACREFVGLAKLAEQHNVQAGFHNHPGFIGGQFWEINPAMDALDPKWAGYYYDLANATAEGADMGWKVDANMALRRLKMLSMKDLIWQKTDKGWHEAVCPIGEGACHTRELLKMVAETGFHGPISIQLEYQIPGASNQLGIALSRETVPKVMAAEQHEIETLKPLLREAYEGS